MIQQCELYSNLKFTVLIHLAQVTCLAVKGCTPYLHTHRAVGSNPFMALIQLSQTLMWVPQYNLAMQPSSFWLGWYILIRGMAAFTFVFGAKRKLLLKSFHWRMRKKDQTKIAILIFIAILLTRNLFFSDTIMIFKCLKPKSVMKHNPTHLSVDVSLDTSRVHALPAFLHFRKFS